MAPRICLAVAMFVVLVSGQDDFELGRDQAKLDIVTIPSFDPEWTSTTPASTSTNSTSTFSTTTTTTTSRSSTTRAWTSRSTTSASSSVRVLPLGHIDKLLEQTRFLLTGRNPRTKNNKNKSDDKESQNEKGRNDEQERNERRLRNVSDSLLKRHRAAESAQLLHQAYSWFNQNNKNEYNDDHFDDYEEEESVGLTTKELSVLRHMDVDKLLRWLLIRIASHVDRNSDEAKTFVEENYLNYLTQNEDTLEPNNTTTTSATSTSTTTTTTTSTTATTTTTTTTTTATTTSTTTSTTTTTTTTTSTTTTTTPTTTTTTTTATTTATITKSSLFSDSIRPLILSSPLRGPNPCINRCYIRSELALQSHRIHWSPLLASPSSRLYKHLSNQIESLMQQLMMDTHLGPFMRSVEVDRFLPYKEDLMLVQLFLVFDTEDGQVSFTDKDLRSIFNLALHEDRLGGFRVQTALTFFHVLRKNEHSKLDRMLNRDQELDAETHFDDNNADSSPFSNFTARSLNKDHTTFYILLSVTLAVLIIPFASLLMVHLYRVRSKRRTRKLLIRNETMKKALVYDLTTNDHRGSLANLQVKSATLPRPRSEGHGLFDEEHLDKRSSRRGSSSLGNNCCRDKMTGSNLKGRLVNTYDNKAFLYTEEPMYATVSETCLPLAVRREQYRRRSSVEETRRRSRSQLIRHRRIDEENDNLEDQAIQMRIDDQE